MGQNAQKASPKEDLKSLKSLFNAHGGRFGDGESSVRWRDTHKFRAFEFSHHTVFVYPYGWSPNAFEISIFAGHLPEAGNLFESLAFTYVPSEKRYVNPDLFVGEINKLSANVSFLGFDLGMSSKDALERYSRYLHNAWPHSDNQRNLRIDAFDPKYNVSHGNIENIYFTLYYEKDRIVFMKFRTGGLAPLGAMGIDHPDMPSIEEGQIPCPTEGP